MPAAPGPALSVGPPPGWEARLHPAQRALGRGRRALLLWLHGGCFTDGSQRAAADRSAWLAAAGADVVALDYPLAPQHAFPAALGVASEALQALAAQPERWTGSPHTALFVGGEEAGGNLAAALAQMTRDQQGPLLAGQLLVTPMLDPQLGSASMRQGACGGCTCPYARGWKAYLGDGIRADHPYAAPGNARRLSGLPDALILSPAGHPLTDESRRYAAALNQQGNVARSLTPPSMEAGCVLDEIHAFLQGTRGDPRMHG